MATLMTTMTTSTRRKPSSQHAVMRTIDLFVRHGGTSTRDHFPEDEEDEIEENTDVRDFILERTDCTPRVREAINRGELYYWQHVSSM